MKSLFPKGQWATQPKKSRYKDRLGEVVTGLTPPGLGDYPHYPLVLALIDDFIPSEVDLNEVGEGFNHGKTLQQLIETGGVDAALQGHCQVIPYNINLPGFKRTALIARALSDVYFQIAQGTVIDAVVLPQEDFIPSPYSRSVQTQIELLQYEGTPVVIASGNGGPDSSNALIIPESFNITAVDVSGQVLSTTTPGNYAAVAGSSSFACASVAPHVARLKRENRSISEIHRQLSQKAQRYNGAAFPNMLPFPVVWEVLIPVTELRNSRLEKTVVSL